MVITFQFSICVKAIGVKENSIYCSKCKLWVHIKCNILNDIDYEYHSGNGDPCFFLKCNNPLFPSAALNNENLMQHILNSSNIKNSSENEFNINQ